MSNTIKLVHNEEQEVELYMNGFCLFQWNKDTDGYTMKESLEDLLETLRYKYE